MGCSTDTSSSVYTPASVTRMHLRRRTQWVDPPASRLGPRNYLMLSKYPLLQCGYHVAPGWFCCHATPNSLPITLVIIACECNRVTSNLPLSVWPNTGFFTHTIDHCFVLLLWYSWVIATLLHGRHHLLGWCLTRVWDFGHVNLVYTWWVCFVTYMSLLSQME